MEKSVVEIEAVKKHISFYSKLVGAIIRAQNINFWVLLAFIPTFISARLIVYYFPELFLEINGVHVHHLTYGIIILSVFGILALNIKQKIAKSPLAMLYGVGLALAFDEFGMWLHLEDDYWIRHSYDAVISITALLLCIVYIPPFIRSVIGLWKYHTKDSKKMG